MESSVSNLTTENNRLKAQSTSISILQEEKLSLESKLSRFENVQDELNKEKSKSAELEKELSEWKGQTNLFNSTGLGSRGLKIQEEFSNIEKPLSDILTKVNIGISDSNPTAESIASYLDSIRGMNEGLKLRCGSQEERIKSLKSDLRETNQEVFGRSSQKEEELKNKIKDLEEQSLRSNKTNERLNDEISKLNSLLKSYENESESHKNSYETSHSKRIEILEIENENKRKRLAELEEELKLKSEESSKFKESSISDEEKEEIKKDRLELNVVRSQLKNLENEINKLSKENSELDFRLRRGEFNPDNERCLVLKDNPVSQDLAVRTSTLKALKEENEALLKRIDEISKQLERVSSKDVQIGSNNVDGEQNENGESALVPRQTADNLRLEIQNLNESMKSKDKAMLRLKQVS